MPQNSPQPQPTPKRPWLDTHPSEAFDFPNDIGSSSIDGLEAFFLHYIQFHHHALTLQTSLPTLITACRPGSEPLSAEDDRKQSVFIQIETATKRLQDLLKMRDCLQDILWYWEVKEKLKRMVEEEPRKEPNPLDGRIGQSMQDALRNANAHISAIEIEYLEGVQLYSNLAASFLARAQEAHRQLDESVPREGGDEEGVGSNRGVVRKAKGDL